MSARRHVAALVAGVLVAGGVVLVRPSSDTEPPGPVALTADEIATRAYLGLATTVPADVSLGSVNPYGMRLTAAELTELARRQQISKKVGGISQALLAARPREFAGAYIDYQLGGRVIVRRVSASADPAILDVLRSNGVTDYGIEPAMFTLAHLAAVERRLARVASDQSLGVTSYSTDLRHNVVDVSVLDPAAPTATRVAFDPAIRLRRGSVAQLDKTD